MYLVAETFESINGEGLHAGYLAHFIRLSGCPLRCSYCDTAWAQEANVGTKRSLEDLIEEIKASPARFVTLTGGEPLAVPLIGNLIGEILNNTDKYLEIETSGAVDISPLLESFLGHKRLSFTIDYKLPSSGMEAFMLKDHYLQLRHQDVVKYVIGSEEDLRVATEHANLISLKGSQAVPIFSPVFGKIEPARIVEVVKDKALTHVKVQLQLHKYIWDPQLQGV